MKTFLTKYFKYIVLAALLYMPIFGFLDTIPVRDWDESRLAINAFEMYKNNNWIVTHAFNEPDLWNTKPPLMIWCQVIFMKIIGPNDLALRLPSAFAAFFTCLALLILSIRYLKNFWFGFIAIIVLITSQGYIDIHVTRTGDYDAMLTFFTTLSALCFFIYLENLNKKFLYLFFITLSLAVLTKGIVGLFYTPALFVYVIIKKQFFQTIKNKHFYLGLLIFVFLVFGYYLLRELFNPGYIDAVMNNELGGRFLKVNENHKGDFWYYYYFIIRYHFSYYLIIPCGILIGIFHKNQIVKNLSIFSTLSFLTFFIIISISKTKLSWYTAPIFPFMAILTSVFINFIFDFLNKPFNLKFESLSKNSVPFIFLFIYFINPYRSIIEKTYKPTEWDSHKEYYQIGYFLKDALKNKVNIDNMKILIDDIYVQNIFYVKVLQDRGVNVNFIEKSGIKKNDTLIVSEQRLKEYVQNNYNSQLIKGYRNIFIYVINDNKPQP